MITAQSRLGHSSITAQVTAQSRLAVTILVTVSSQWAHCEPSRWPIFFSWVIIERWELGLLTVNLEGLLLTMQKWVLWVIIKHWEAFGPSTLRGCRQLGWGAWQMIARAKGGLSRYHVKRIHFTMQGFGFVSAILDEAKLMAMYYYYGSAAII